MVNRVRRSYRFGQTRPVTVDVITTEGEKNILANLQRKADAANRMFRELVFHMNEATNIDRASVWFPKNEEFPQWL